MRQPIFKTAIAMGIILFSFPAFAQKADAKGCKDHPIFERIEKYFISDCNGNADEYVIMMGENKPKPMEGNVTEITYRYDAEAGATLPSRSQVVKNYEDAIVKMGGQKIYSNTKEDAKWRGGTFKIEKNQNIYWVGVYNMINDPVDQFRLIVVEQDKMMVALEKNDMFEQIDSGEAVILNFNFEPETAKLQRDSMRFIYDIFGMMKRNPGLKITIEGHTDTMGSKESSMALSESRAESVKSALVSKGISSDRISTKGYGSSKPVSDNKSEEGRAKNRRMEIKKQN